MSNIIARSEFKKFHGCRAIGMCNLKHGSQWTSRLKRPHGTDCDILYPQMMMKFGGAFGEEKAIGGREGGSDSIECLKHLFWFSVFRFLGSKFNHSITNA